MNVQVVDVLAVARLTRLVTSDTLTASWRARVIRYAYEHRGDGRVPVQLPDREWVSMVENDHEAPLLAELITCRWCVSVWCGLFVVCARRLVPRVWDPIARALAASMVTGLATRIEH